MGLQLNEIQGNILRGYRKTDATHFSISFAELARAAKFLQGLLQANKSGLGITIAAVCDKPPNIV